VPIEEGPLAVERQLAVAAQAVERQATTDPNVPLNYIPCSRYSQLGHRKVTQLWVVVVVQEVVPVDVLVVASVAVLEDEGWQLIGDCSAWKRMSGLKIEPNMQQPCQRPSCEPAQ
jgi:hypothetical protein